jgi:hypothetical protein
MYYETSLVRLSNHSLVREQSKPIRWSYRNKKNSSRRDQPEPVSLEDEIVRLRTTMEQAFVDNQSLTAEIVVEISRKLDEKINEYMRKSK